MLDASHVVGVLRSHMEQEAGNIDGIGRGPQRCLVMPAAERSLTLIIDAEQIAGRDLVGIGEKEGWSWCRSGGWSVTHVPLYCTDHVLGAHRTKL